MHLKLAVLEGRWWPKRNTSVRGVLDLISDVTGGTPHGYHYETFAGPESFAEAVQRLGRQRGLRYLYVASHGTKDGLTGISDALVPRRAIVEAFRDVSLDGVLFGCCDFGREELAADLLACAPKLNWVAGYGSEIDWIASMALDMVFWNAVGEAIAKDLGVVKTRAYVLERMAATFLFQTLNLGFDLYVRDRAGGADGVMASAVGAELGAFITTNGDVLEDAGFRLVELDTA